MQEQIRNALMHANVTFQPGKGSDTTEAFVGRLLAAYPPSIARTCSSNWGVVK